MQANCLEKFDSFVKGLSKKDKIALIHDLDADGVSSGVITFNALKLLRAKKIDVVITQAFKTTQILPKTLEILEKKKINKVIVVDFALDQGANYIDVLESLSGDVVLIDHHKDYGYFGNGKTVIVKPQFFSKIEPSKYPASKLAFDLFSRHVDLSQWSYVAGIGIIGDNQLLEWREFVLQSAIKSKSSIRDLSRCADIISAVETLKPKKLNELFLFIASINGPQKLLKSKFSGFTKILEKELNILFKKFKNGKEVFENQELIWFYFKSKTNIKSALINRISSKMYPDKTVICVQDKNDGYVSFSARRQDFKVKTNELLENAVEGFENAGAGGHVPAAAGRVMKKDLQEFKRRVTESLSKKY